MKPSIGRIVHFVPMAEGADHVAAVIVRVLNDTSVNLRLITDNSSLLGYVTSVALDSTGVQKYTWHWPEVVS